MSAKKCSKAQNRLEEFQKRLKKERVNQEKSAKKEGKNTKAKIDESKNRQRLSSQTDSIVKGLLKPSEVFQRSSIKKTLDSLNEGLLEGRRNAQDKASSSRQKPNLQNRVIFVEDSVLDKRSKSTKSSLKLSDVLTSKEFSNKNKSKKNVKTKILDEKQLVKLNRDNAQKSYSYQIINDVPKASTVDKKSIFKRPSSESIEMESESSIPEVETKKAKSSISDTSNQIKINFSQTASKFLPSRDTISDTSNQIKINFRQTASKLLPSRDAISDTSNQIKINFCQNASKLVPSRDNKKEKREIKTETGKANLYKRKTKEDRHKTAMRNESQENRFIFDSKPISPLRQEENDLSMDFEINKNHLQNVRNIVDTSEVEEMDWEMSVLNPVQNVPNKPSVIYVVDTNVFLSSLSLIKKIKSTVIKGLTPLIVVPWQVLKELDYLKKDSSSISKNARAATNHLLEWLSASDSSITGQTAQNANTDFPGFKVEVADDHLIKCCLQLKINNPCVILLTNDKNLGVKSLVNQVPTLSDEQLTSLLNNISVKKEKLHLIETPPTTNDVHMFKIYKLTNTFKDCISQMIEKCLRDKYGDIWVLYAPGEPPWCIRLIIRTLNNISHLFPPEISKKIIEPLRKIGSILNSYEKDFKITLCEGEKIGKAFYYLIKTMGFMFKSETEIYDKQSAFYKSKDSEDIESTYSLECCKLTMAFFNFFYEKIISFCCWISNTSGIPFNVPCQIDSNFQDFKLEDVPNYQKNINLLIRALESIHQVPIENITGETEGLKVIYCILLSYSGKNKNLYPDFSCEDVLEFSINPIYRQYLPYGIEKLYKFNEYLSQNNKHCTK